MTSAPKTIGTTPVKITNAGQSGSCWMVEDGTDSTCPEMFVYHNGRTIAEGIRVFPRTTNSEILLLTADSPTDFYYAVCKNGSGTLIVDVI